jgi:hypothetical protein
VVGVSVGPSVAVGRGAGARCPLTKPAVAAVERTPGGHRAPLQPGRASRRHVGV